jgi:uncharacterized protein YggE
VATQIRTWLGAALILGAAASPSSAADKVALMDSLPHVTTTGVAHLEVKPDLAVISLGVRIDKPTAQDALAETARVAKGLIDDLVSQNVAERDIRTIDLTLVAIYDEEHDDRGRVTKRTLQGYRAQDMFSVRIRNVDNAGALARRALDHGANIFNGVDFRLENAADRRIDLGGEAVRRARQQADVYARALGLTLGRVLDIGNPDQGGNGVPRARFAAAPASTPAGETPIPLAPGIIDIDASATVTFELKGP